MAIVFDDLLAKGVRAGEIPARTDSARDWYRNRARTTRVAPDRLIRGDRERLTSRVMIGRMYHFFYDPKHKKTLPYYDRFPLIFPFKRVRGGFLGINLHYLPLRLRAKLMDELYTLSRDNRYDENTRLRISYNILNGAAKYKYFKPCVKHYLTPHVKSRFLEVYAAEWDIALFLPTERFVGAGKSTVHADSRKMI
jgi:hypothetical protein